MIELEETLRRAVVLDRPVVLIIDGLDHIARVRTGSSVLALLHTDIVERLTILEVPHGVALVIGSQPGSHLNVFRDRWGTEIEERQVPPWTAADIEGLASRHGVEEALSAAKILENDQVAQVLTLLGERADGSPLFARYLARGLVEGLKDGTIVNPHDWLADVPMVEGDVAVYYKYLYQTASQEAQTIADVLGVIDFSVSEADLKEILPAFVGNWVPQALRGIRPVLEVAAAQGGMRIFHESFRRFMLAEQSRQGRSIANALEPVITWLKGRDYFEDAKSYRFLLPALRRAGRNKDVLTHVGVSFVSDSVAHAHSSEGIERNIAIAADVAARERNWVALVRCAELQGSTYTCFFDFPDPENHYWPTYIELFGAEALADRLLFDGRPTTSRDEGLLVCSLVDDAGGRAPWRKYLGVDDDIFKKDAQATPDLYSGLTREERVNLAAVHGRLRTGTGRRILQRLYTHLREAGNEFNPDFVRALAASVARLADPGGIERLASLADPATKGGARITARAAAVLRLGVADEYLRSENRRVAAEWATRAAQTVDTPELAVSCMLYGAPVELARHTAIDPSTLAIAVGPDEFLDNSSGVRNWVASIRLLATDPSNWPAVATRERERISEDGWYRCWLRFVICLAGVEAGRRHGETEGLDHAFAELTRDTHPFRGKPQATDLYFIRGVIAETLTWALSLVQTAEEWALALDAIRRTSLETTATLDREDAGPIPTSTLLDVLMPYAADPVAGPRVRQAFEQEVERRNQNGTYYGRHAEFEMRLARVRYRAGDATSARDAWLRSSVFLAAYGFHKDITIFDLIESAPALTAVSQQAALSALAEIQPLTMAAVVHTDGRETRNAPNAWFSSLLKVDPPIAISLLARTAAAENGTGGWPTTEAIRDLAKTVADSADPLLLDASLRTVPMDTSTEHEASKDVDARLAPIARLAAVDRDLAQQVFRRVMAEIEDHGGRQGNSAAEHVHRIAAQLGFQLTTEAQDNTQQGEAGTETPSVPAEAMAHAILKQPVFPPSPSFVDLVKGLRAAGQRRERMNPEEWDAIVRSLANRLGELLDGGHEDDAERVLRFFARDVPVVLTSTVKIHPLAPLAEALETAGYRRAAAIAYTLAYTVARGGMGWLHLGDSSHGYLISRAIALNRESTQTVLAQEIAYALRASSNTAGTSRHLIERLAGWGDVALAELSWREAFTVFAHRLPLVPEWGWFERLELDTVPNWTVDEALVALMLGQLSEPRLRQKLGALDGVVRAIQCRPEVARSPIRWWLTLPRSGTTSTLVVFAALIRAEIAPWPITTALSDVLKEVVAGKSWGPRQFALQLLRRAGLPKPSVPPDVPTATAADASFTRERCTKLRFADVGNTLEKLEPLWPGLPDLVLRRLHQLLQDDSESKDRCSERYQLMWGRTARQIPATPVLLWETEMFVKALHTELTGLSAHLWEVGHWTPDIEDSLVTAITPDTRLHLGLAASRTTRPPWPSHDVIQEGVGPLKILCAEDDPAYEGWMRLAIVERQYISDPQHPHEPPDEVVRLFGGAVATPIGERIPHGAFPFEDGNPQNWWSEPPPARFPAHIPFGPMIRLHRTNDWLGDAFVLIPPLFLRSYATLEPPEYDTPLVWHDSEGAPAVVLRTWRVRDVEVTYAEAVKCEGTDLIARPDIAARLRSLLAVDLQELTLVDRADLRQPDE